MVAIDVLSLVVLAAMTILRLAVPMALLFLVGALARRWSSSV